MKTTFLFILITFISYSQAQKTDAFGNFSVTKNKLVWQKEYYLEDEYNLDKLLQEDAFTTNLRILKFKTSAITNLFQLTVNNLPQYAKSSYRAFIVIDIYHDSFRVTVKEITFPDFVEKRYYYNGMSNKSGGTLDYYILRDDGVIKQNSVSQHVLNSFNTSFEEIFDAMATPLKE